MDIIQLFHQADTENTIYYGAILLLCAWLIIGSAKVIIKGDVRDKDGKVISRKMGVLAVIFFSFCFYWCMEGMRTDVNKQSSVSSQVKAADKTGNLVSDMTSGAEIVMKLGKKLVTHLHW